MKHDYINVPPFSNMAWWAGHDRAKGGQYFDPSYRYTQEERDQYRAGFRYGHDARVEEQLKTVRRPFKA